MSPVTHVSQDEFDRQVLKADTPVLVDFYGTWCPPCRMLAPILEQLAAHYQGRVRVVKVDVDAQPGLARYYGISAVPTLLFFRDGQAVHRLTGLQPPQVLQAVLDDLLASPTGPA